MYKYLTAVFIFIAIVLAGSIFLVLLYSPVDTQTRLSYDGFLIPEDGSPQGCTVSIGGTVRTYRLNVRQPQFFNNVYNNKEGLIINGQQVLNKLSFAWNEEENRFSRMVRNGITFTTDRELSFLLAIIPDGKDADIDAIAPAASEQEAKQLLRSIIEDPEFQRRWKDDAASLKEYLD
ncbi:MAG: hypothetical protein J6J18_00875 [Oscillospiraceae bacterium]|nr:hypothetical protein [Oscillospiraceae bacterium]